jgi:hypothetical protein
MLALLPADLKELRLLGVQQLSDRDMAGVARFARLRELAVHSIGNHQVSHAALKVGGLCLLRVHVVQRCGAGALTVQCMWSDRCDGCVCLSRQVCMEWRGAQSSGMLSWTVY